MDQKLVTLVMFPRVIGTAVEGKLEVSCYNTLHTM